MSHTPGPWRVDEDGFVWGCCPGPAFMKTAHFLVAEVRGWGYLQYRADGEQVQAANARLIAAAPEMYEALERLIKSLLSNDTDCQATLQEVLRGGKPSSKD